MSVERDLKTVDERLDWSIENHNRLERDFRQLLAHLGIKFEDIPAKRVITAQPGLSPEEQK